MRAFEPLQKVENRRWKSRSWIRAGRKLFEAERLWSQSLSLIIKIGLVPEHLLLEFCQPGEDLLWLCKSCVVQRHFLIVLKAVDSVAF